MHNPIDDLVKFTLWLQAKYSGAALKGLSREQVQKLAEEWYESEHGDEHG